MVTPKVGAVVLVKFPFSDLSATKLRPAVVLADVQQGDWLLSQITSNAYGDSRAIELMPGDFAAGSLMRVSYARPGKLFAANTSIMHTVVGTLRPVRLDAIIDAVIAILKPAA